MAKYLTRQRKRLLEYLSEHTDGQMTARQIADALTADNISTFISLGETKNKTCRQANLINYTK